MGGAIAIIFITTFIKAITCFIKSLMLIMNIPSHNFDISYTKTREILVVRDEIFLTSLLAPTAAPPRDENVMRWRRGRPFDVPLGGRWEVGEGGRGSCSHIEMKECI